MPEEKKEEDIIKKLEELRKRPKAEEAARPTAAIVDEETNRKRRARIIGALVILIVVVGLFFFGYQKIISPLKREAPPEAQPGATVQPTVTPSTPKPTEVLTETEYKKELEKTKSAKIEEANSLLAGLPVELNSFKEELIRTINAKNKIEDARAIDVALISTEIWREAKRREVDKKQAVSPTAAVISYLYYDANYTNYEMIKGADNIKNNIELLTIPQLKLLDIKATKYEYVPIRLPRTRAGGFVEKGDTISIYYREPIPTGIAGVIPSLYSAAGGNVTIKHLVKDGTVIEIMRAQSAGTISISESEQKTDTGGGTEGIGTVPTISIGSLGSITNESGFGASIGYKTRQTASTYSVNLAEVQKAAAAGKISEKELMQNLEKYGVRLNALERETNLGNLDEEFLVLVEVTEEEAKSLVLRLLDSTERGNLFVSISVKPQWAK